MSDKQLPDFFINAFYHRRFRDNLFVIKASGKVIEDSTTRDTLIANIRDLTLHGIRVLLIYGGGRAIDAEAEKRGIKTVKHDGRRVTDAATIGVIRQVVGGDLALGVQSSMAKLAMEGIAFNAIPYDWMQVELRAKKPIDFGFVGDVKAVHNRPIQRLFKTTSFIACPCLAFTADGALCNINADTIATELAIGTQANKLVFLSDVDGVTVDGTVQSLMTSGDIDTHIKSGAITGGMKVKLENCQRALGEGVQRIHLINGLRENALVKEIFEPDGFGTMILETEEHENYMNELRIQKAIELHKGKGAKQSAGA